MQACYFTFRMQSDLLESLTAVRLCLFPQSRCAGRLQLQTLAHWSTRMQGHKSSLEYSVFLRVLIPELVLKSKLTSQQEAVVQSLPCADTATQTA